MYLHDLGKNANIELLCEQNGVFLTIRTLNYVVYKKGLLGHPIDLILV